VAFFRTDGPTANPRILRTMTPRSRGLRAALLVLGALIALALPITASAHADLVSATPADKSTVSGTPSEIVLTFSESLNPTKSSLVLLDSSSSQVAKAGVDPADDKVMRLTPPALDPGAYEIDWTSDSLDGHLLRGKVTFTVTAPTPSPSVAPTTAPTATASTTPATSAAPTPSPTPSAVPPPTSASGADVIVPVLVAIVLIAVLGAWLVRGRISRGPR
jgi:methionine-rich copper-binding protein CopC